MANEQEEISRLEYNLAEFLIDFQSSHFTDIRVYAYKYNNLKIYMNPTSVSKPHFFVKFGISEACFSIETGYKIEGSLGPEERMVQNWASRINIHRALETYWKDMTRKSKIKQQEILKKNQQHIEESNEESSINISAIIRGQKKKKATQKRQSEKWGKKKYGKEEE